MVSKRASMAAMKKHICMLVLSPALPDIRVMREASSLVEAGYDVSIVDIEHDASRPSEEVVRGVRIHHVFVSDRSRRHYSPVQTLPWLAFKASRMLRSAWTVLRTKADAFHAHDITALPACIVAAAVYGKPLIFDAHELPMTQRHLMERKTITRLSQALLRLMMRRCTHAITVSPPLVDEMQTRYGGPRAVLVRNVPEYREPAGGDKLRCYFGLPPQTRIALYQGYFQENRSLDVLVRTAQYLPDDVAIAMIGKGPDLEKVLNLARELRVENRIKIKDFVPHEELLSWTASADLGLSIFSRDISPSTRYCLPNKVFEYLMAGLPILTTQLEAVVELVQRYGVGRVIDSMEPRAVAAGIVGMLSDKNALAQMRANALTACRNELRWNVEAKELIQLYDNVFQRSAQIGVPKIEARA